MGTRYRSLPRPGAASVQDKTIQAILRHANLSTTMNAYVKSVAADATAAMKAFEDFMQPTCNRAGAENVAVMRDSAYVNEKFGGSVCESNAPLTSKMPIAGFEDRESHRTPFASAIPSRQTEWRERSNVPFNTLDNGDCISAGPACLRLVTERARTTPPGKRTPATLVSEPLS